jgi:glycine betaine transporter
MSIKKLVVAVDFSAPSLKALQTAIDLAQQLDGVLHVIYVADMNEKKSREYEADGSNSVEMKIINEFKSQLEALVDKMSNNEIEVQIGVEFGDPTVGIVRAAKEINADLIIMGTHGRTGIEHVLVGSVAESVLRKTTIPLICVRARPAEAG